jgi:hypothetical protein
MSPAQLCRSCGCSDEQACSIDDYWVEDDLCSNCAVKGVTPTDFPDRARLLQQMGRDVVRPHLWPERGRRVA